jgi:2-succinyl-5-enolpyruvyl-6-hydroxy-3-cyclohexene-1-carboxylate synthase
VDAALAPNRNLALATALVDELARAGVRHFCVCPGSRSTPLAAALVALRRADPGVRLWSQIDERSAGFFALGLAKATRAPAAVVCTSGTAAANLLPAVVEANLTAVPLVLLTADRPPELRDWGAAQTIDQVRLFGVHARWFAELPTPEPTPSALRHTRALGARAAAIAAGRPAGPVHLNVPFREPLEPEPVAADRCAELAADPAAATGRGSSAWSRISWPPARPDALVLQWLAARIATTPNGVIAAGPLAASDGLGAAALRLARAAGWPLLAEPTSQLRCGAHAVGPPLVSAYDLFLRNEALAAELAPAVVLRLGAPLTSKPFAAWLARHGAAELWLVDPDERHADPTHRAAEVLRFDPEALCSGLADELERSGCRAPVPWLARFAESDARARASLQRLLAADDRLLGVRAVAELAEALPAGTTLFVSNSLPVRDVDAAFPPSRRPLRVLANRGANGIDGIVSTALGAAAAGAGPLVLLTGDLALLHDLGGLAAAKRHGLAATIVVLHNDGGGIFSGLPVARHRDAVDFEALFSTPHGVDFAHAAALFGAQHVRAATVETFRLALKQAIGGPGLHLVEVPFDRERDVAVRRELFARAAREAAS